MKHRLCWIASLCLLISCVASDGCTSTEDDECQDKSELHDEVYLLQNSITESHRRLAQLGHTSLEENILDSKMSEDEILVQLQLAKHNHQKWESRIAALQGLLSTSRRSRRSKHSKQSPEPTEAPMEEMSMSMPDALHDASLWTCKMMFPLLIGCAAITIALWEGVTYEQQRAPRDAPWYHDSRCMSVILVSAACVWFASGVFFFTGFFVFTDEERHLTFIESMYLSSQVMTTVGYGDLTPTTWHGQLFMVFYVAIGVSLIASLTGEFLWVALEYETEMLTTRFSFLARHPFFRENKGVLPLITCIIFGTVFYGAIEAEDKTYFEAFYMSIVTLTSVGFGYFSCITPLGQLVGSIWMLFGWVCVATVVKDAGDVILKHRKRLRSRSAALTYFDKICNSETKKNTMDRADFIGFECLRYGLSEADLRRANQAFDMWDGDRSQTLDFKEFKKYVDTVDFFHDPMPESILRAKTADF